MKDKSSLEVTCWYVSTEFGLEFNHISDGYDPTAAAPISISKDQDKAWKNKAWSPRKGILSQNKVTES